MGKYVPTPEPPKGREFYQVHTRKLDRSVAYARMAKAGLKRVNKHDYVRYKTITGMTVEEYQPSYFATHWKEVANAKMKNM